MKVRSVGALVAAAVVLSAAVCVADDCGKQTPHLVDLSSYVVKAKIVSVGKAPGFYSDVIPAVQDVQYNVEQTYKGKLPGNEITVEHRVYKGSRLTQKHPIGLTKKIFAAGTEVILFLKSPTLDIKEECAVQVADAALENQLRDLLHTQ